ncbi:hypothetical protein [Sphingomonas sp. VNH70]|uniref:hypothetical protein n=1 Tax=Sphingomonas silueang TaxID=3156617 RepID=UPI0032B3B194
MNEPIATAATSPAPGDASVTSAKVRTGASLWMPGAAVRSFFDIPLGFYPRLGEPSKSVTPEQIVAQLVGPGGAMEHWDTLDPTDDALDDAIDLAKASLEEAKAQTEYQDGKATRLLTVTTFLTALAGAFFASFATDYPLRTLADQAGGTYWLLLFTYLAFLAFVLFALGGALVTFHATRTRFKYPATATVAKQAGPTKSFLFFREIIGVTPAGWANSFVTVADASGKLAATLRPDLKIEYLKNYVVEAYLVAAKAADKLRYLQPAQSLLAWALRCLLIYIVLLTFSQSMIKPTKPAAQASKVEVIKAPQPLPVQIIAQPAPANAGGTR